MGPSTCNFHVNYPIYMPEISDTVPGYNVIYRTRDSYFQG